MVDRLAALSGPQAWLAWVALASLVIGMTSMLVQAVVKAPVRTGQSLAFRTAFVLIFARITYRLIGGGGPVTYATVAIYALPGIACAWAILDAMRHRNEQPIRTALIAAQEREIAWQRKEIARLRLKAGESVELSDMEYPGAGA